VILALPEGIALPVLNHLVAEGLLDLDSPGKDEIKNAAKARLGRA
jgi:hypothetical protein